MSEFVELPPIATEPVSVILLARDAVGSLEATLREWQAGLEARGQAYELILVDDGSSDDTGVLAEKLAGQMAALRVLRQPRPGGLGRALQRGLDAAQYPLVLYTTADGQYAPADGLAMFQWIDQVQLVCGYRSRPLSQWRDALRERVGRWFIRWLFGLRLKDPHCVYVLARRSAFRRTPLQSAGVFGHGEILAKANFLGCLMTDAPVQHRPPADIQQPITKSSLRQTINEARRVLAHPDFGPPFLFEDTPWARDWVRALSPFA